MQATAESRYRCSQPASLVWHCAGYKCRLKVQARVQEEKAPVWWSSNCPEDEKDLVDEEASPGAGHEYQTSSPWTGLRVSY
ncbi:hypothetical protein GN956_G15077 [Arapaima gigas]